MSDSRLEKFIYAICSMDVSDLPVPLSRIETLWNCLITGETPDFEPLSRNEKYLMAMLDRYDISNLPAPMSRGEKLLYKIAVGETDLSDVPGYLSRYEELLKYLIENGGIGFEYVLYTLNQSLSTLYNTAEKPVKSAILKGQTLVNVALTQYMTPSNNASINGETITLDLSRQWSLVEFSKDNTLLIPNEVYTCILYDVVGDTTNVNFSIQNGSSTKLYLKDVGYKFKFTMGVGNNHTNRLCYVENLVATSGTVSFKMVLLKGDYTNVDVPYFTGMQSVKMPVLTTTGKNLFDGEIEEGIIDANTGEPQTHGGRSRSKNFIRVPKNTDLYIKVENGGSASWTTIYGYDENKKYLGCIINSSGANKTFNTGDASYIKWKNNAPMDTLGNIQIEEGSVATSYEPYKSNILSCNEEITLCGIGDVKDTLDGNTGELTQRIGEIVIDENNDIRKESYCENVDEGFFKFITEYVEKPKNNNYISNKLQKINVYELTNAVGFTLIGGKGKYRYLFCIKSSELSELSLNGCKQWLAKNPIAIQYQLATESIKTVDLTTVDQDGQPTKLKTFNDITYVEIKADNLIPSVDLEVATKINEALSTMGLEHHDISETQNKLSQTVDEQTENTDATMMATTEIYEQTL